MGEFLDSRAPLEQKITTKGSTNPVVKVYIALSGQSASIIAMPKQVHDSRISDIG